MTPLERLIALEAIRDLRARRDHAFDRKDRATYAAPHSDDHVARSIGPDAIVGGQAAADALATLMANVVTVHHSHTPVIEFDEPTTPAACGRWR